MAAYDFVGAGRGSYEQDVVTSHYGWRIRKCCLCVLATVPVCLIGGLFVTMRSDQSSTTTSTTGLLLATTTGLNDLLLSTSLPATTSTTAPPYDCNEGDPEDWAPGQTRWCCDREEIGCNVTTPPPPPELQQGDLVSTTAEFECNSGEDFLTWNVTKRVFCCVHHKQGCPTTPPPVPDPPLPDPAVPKEGCSSDCSFQGHLSTCSGHIQWAAELWYANTSNACLTAFGLLLQHCPSCSSCTIAQAGCNQPTEPPTTSLFQGVLEVGTAEAAADAPPPGADAGPKADQGAKSEARDGDESFNCDPDTSDVDAWTIKQRVYCCKEEEVACPKPPGGSKKPHKADSSASTPEHNLTHSKTDECDANLEEDWDFKQKIWCCTHKQVGCATTTEFEFNCEAAFSTWQQAWSDDKKKWCCENQGLGCVEDSD